ncbi:MAG: amidohydrolase family protein, partial [Negativicutes bacterium]|nr:amidohydrolase family protein [Negativicutes bacterium]
IHKMTGMVADRLRLSDRGRITVGAWADLTVFDFNTIGANGSITQPTEYPNGIAYVLVNGKLTWDNGIYHDVRGGKAIRNPKRFSKA